MVFLCVCVKEFFYKLYHDLSFMRVALFQVWRRCLPVYGTWIFNLGVHEWISGRIYHYLQLYVNVCRQVYLSRWKIQSCHQIMHAYKSIPLVLGY